MRETLAAFMQLLNLTCLSISLLGEATLDLVDTATAQHAKTVEYFSMAPMLSKGKPGLEEPTSSEDHAKERLREFLDKRFPQGTGPTGGPGREPAEDGCGAEQDKGDAADRQGGAPK
jgi:hypothetical protein